MDPSPAAIASPAERAPRPGLQVAVVMERIRQPNQWEDYSFRVVEVVPDEGAFGSTARCLLDDGKHSRWLHPGLRIELFPDECKGYFLNLTSGRPSWFVMWRIDENDPSLAVPQTVSVSYIEGDRWMAAEERVHNVPLADELCEWLRLFTNEHFRPEPRHRRRAASFLSPEERERLAREPGESP